MEEITLERPKISSFFTGLDPDPWTRLSTELESLWRGSGSTSTDVLHDGGLFGVYVVRRSEGRWFEDYFSRPVSRRMASDQEDVECRIIPSLSGGRPVLALNLRGVSHDYIFYLDSPTPEAALERLLTAYVMHT